MPLTVTHTTTYRYRRPIWLGPHRLLLLPRTGHDIRLANWRLESVPPATIAWSQDLFGNAAATASFAQAAETLTIESSFIAELQAPDWPIYAIAPRAHRYPFTYTDEEWDDLGALRNVQHVDPSGRLGEWARGFVMGPTTDTLSLLRDLNAGVGDRIAYQSRDAEGTQTPLETLDRTWGSCRDFAVLLMEALRSLGFGTRVVSGYLYNPVASNSPGTTHAWVEVYLPGAGWIALDPTNRTLGSPNLIPVAVGRHIGQVMPVSGSFDGIPDDFIGMTVAMSVEREPDSLFANVFHSSQ